MSANKNLFLLHSTVATAAGLGLIFAPAMAAPAVGLAGASASAQTIFGGLFVMFAGILCTVAASVTPSVSRCVGTAEVTGL